MKKLYIPVLVVIACIVMGIVDAVIQPGYVPKSAIKIAVFLMIPFVYGFFNKECNIKKLFKPEKKGIILAAIMGVGVYIVVVGAYLIVSKFFDFSSITSSVNKANGVNSTNFVWVAIYISFVNSFLEEFFFRGFAFLSLKEVTSRRFAYIFSSLMFALYHIAMMIGWFALPVVFIALLGLFVGGMIFNRFDESKENIYLSWLVHMFANFATNTIGFILFAA